MRLAAVLSGIVLCATLGLAQAQPTWDELTSEQQRQFQRYAEQWNDMPDERRAQIIANHERWKRMSPKQRREYRRKYRENIKKLTPAQLQALRECYRRRKAGEDIDCPKP